MTWRKATSPHSDRVSDIELVDELIRLHSIVAALSAATEKSFSEEGRGSRAERNGVMWVFHSLIDEFHASIDAWKGEIERRHLDRETGEARK